MKSFKLVILLLLINFLFLIPVPVLAKVWINEFSSNGSEDWIELYNDADESVSLEDMRIRDSSSTNKLDVTGHIEANGFAVFEWATKLNNSEDTIKLLLKSEETTVIDEVTYGDAGNVPAPEFGRTAGKQTDGGSHWVLFTAASKGYSNSNSAVVPTATEIPINTPTPTHEPTPTKTPTPVKVPTKTPVSSDSITDELPIIKTSKKSPTESVFRISGVPTSILGISTNSATPKPTKKAAKPMQKVLVKNAETSPFFTFIAGAVFLIACGILVFLKQRHKNHG